jgi:hypothetical protein
MAIGAGQGVTTTGEVGIEWRIVLIDGVQISSSGVGLPDFHQRVCRRPRIFVEHAAGDDNPLAQRRSFVLTCQIDDARGDIIHAELWPGHFGKGLWDRD